MNTERRDTQERLTYRIMATKSKKEENRNEKQCFPSSTNSPHLVLGYWTVDYTQQEDDLTLFIGMLLLLNIPPPPPNRPIDIVLFRADQHKPEIILLQQKIDLHWYNKPNLILDFHNRMHNFHEFNFHILEVRCRLKY